MLDERSRSATTEHAKTSQAARYVPYAAAILLMTCPILISSADGTLFADGCELRAWVRAVVDHQPRAHSECRAVPLSIDLPSLAIGVSSALAIPLYYAMRRHLMMLDDRMRQVRLVPRSEPSIVDFSVSLPRTRRSLLGAATVGLLVLVVGSYFYAHVESAEPWTGIVHHYLGYADPPMPEGSWWAAPEHRWARVSWLLVGWVGACFAILQARLNWLLVRRLRRSDVPKTRYLRKDCDGQHGWADFDWVFTLSLLGAANFLLAIFPILYLLIGHEATTGAALVAFTATAFGGVMCVCLILQFRTFVRTSYAVAFTERAERLERKIKRGGRAGRTARDDLDRMGPPGRFPLSGPWKKALQGAGAVILAIFLGVMGFAAKWLFDAIFGTS